MSQKRALEGCRVVDIGQVWAGPLAGQILADMGAEVIYIESEKHRGSAMMNVPTGEQPFKFCTVGRNKLGVSLDLTQPGAVELFRGLVRISDVVITNSAPGTIEKLGLTYPVLRAERPDLVMVALSAAGQTGPLKDLLAYGPGLNAVSGVDSTLGYDDTGDLMCNFEGDPDPVAGMTAAFLVLAALHYRERTGRGQYIDLSFWENQTCHMGEAVMDYLMNGRVAGPQGNTHPRMAPHGNYPARGEDKWVSIAVETEEEWRAFCRVMGDPSWARDERFLDAFGRLKNRRELDRHVSAWTRQHAPEELREALQQAGVACFPVLSIPELYADPHERYQQQSVLVEDPTVTPQDMIYGIPWRLSETPGSIRRPQPELGQHNDYVLGELMGVPASWLSALMEQKVIA